MTSGRQLQFLGATGTVTGSKYLLTSGGTRLLVDCGLYQGIGELRQRNWDDPPFSPRDIDAVVLTHAHIDHCGYLPRLVSQGFAGPVYLTERTADLAAIVLPDSGFLNEEEAAYANRKGYSRHDPALPLYTREEAIAATRRFKAIGFGEPVEVAPDVTVTLSRAGHILGAATVAVRLGDPGSTVAFSGDLGRGKHPFLVAPDPPPAADHLIVESTYGNREHLDTEPVPSLAEIINETIANGGNVIIPAFAVDRTEVILHHLAMLSTAGQIPADLPVFVDSPMALAALAVYRSALADGDADIEPRFHGTDPFHLPGLCEVSDVEGSKALNHPDRPCVIVSAAGMASGGRVVHHLASLLPNARNTVALVGFQAAGTRGRRLLEGATELKMLGRYVPVRARIVNLPQYSVHADASELLDWVAAAPREPRGIYVVHGEPPASAALAASVREKLDWTAVVPRYGERVRVD